MQNMYKELKPFTASMPCPLMNISLDTFVSGCETVTKNYGLNYSKLFDTLCTFLGTYIYYNESLFN
jgi:hypothetical protein